MRMQPDPFDRSLRKLDFDSANQLFGPEFIELHASGTPNARFGKRTYFRTASLALSWFTVLLLPKGHQRGLRQE
jgi:hypothetical protein